MVRDFTFRVRSGELFLAMKETTSQAACHPVVSEGLFNPSIAWGSSVIAQWSSPLVLYS